MKGIKKWKFCFGFVLVLALSLFLSFSFPKNVNAYSNTTGVNTQVRSISIDGVVTYDTGFTGFRTFPINLLQSSGSQRRTLQGYQFSYDLSDTSSDQYHTLNFSFNIYQAAGTFTLNTNAPITATAFATRGGASFQQRAECSLTESNYSDYVKYGCSVTFDNYQKITSIWVGVGSYNATTLVDHPLGTIYGGLNNNNIQMTYFGYEILTTADPSIALLNQQIQQNTTIINNINETNEYLSEQAEQDQEDRDNVSNTSSDAENSANEGSSDADDVSTSLLGAITTLITALGSVHETNCKLPDFSIYGLEFTDMDLCTFDVPSSIMTLGSIGLVFIIVPLGVNLVKRMISLYNEIVGGGK